MKIVYGIISIEEVFRNLLRYSVPLVVSEDARKGQTDGQKDISDLLGDKDKTISGPKNPVYADNYHQRRLGILYSSAIGAYLDRRIEALHDFSDRVPGKHMDVLPINIMGGVLGFTYLGDNRITRRDDLTGSLAKMVDIHECIHTPDEYETRVLTSWIMAKEKVRYIR